MPTYVYKFTDTGETVEVQQAFTDPTLTEYQHPVDGTVRAVKKVFMPVGVTFKGSGFYKTDSRGSGSKSTSSSTSSTDSSSSSSSTGSSTSSDTSSSTPSSSPASSTSSSASSTPSSSGAAAG
jgi:predicted nucleic acid-binding Zn ribbon protein